MSLIFQNSSCSYKSICKEVDYCIIYNMHNIINILFYICADSTDYLLLAGKAGHEASKGAVTYYNASFVDVSYSICYWHYFFDILE